MAYNPEWRERVARALWEADAAEEEMTARDWEDAKVIDLAAAYYSAAEHAADYLLWMSAGAIEGEPLSNALARAYWRERLALMAERGA